MDEEIRHKLVILNVVKSQEAIDARNLHSCLGNTMGYFHIMHRASCKVSKGNSKSLLV
jgi:hypothetical protein